MLKGNRKSIWRKIPVPMEKPMVKNRKKNLQNLLKKKLTNFYLLNWRGGRAAECTGLENRQGFMPFGGSNPSPSASKAIKKYLERCPSGLRSTLGKRVCVHAYRGFESRPLRCLIGGKLFGRRVFEFIWCKCALQIDSIPHLGVN